MEGFMHVKPGDRVLRLMAETAEMDLIVKQVGENLIWATLEEWLNLDPLDHPGNYWTFDRRTGVEEDPDLGWGLKYGVTGSRLVKVL